MSSNLNDPVQIAAYRRQLFELKDEITLPAEDWQAIWPYIDNIWVERNASRAKDRQQFNCRIWRNDSDKKAGSGQRNRVRRDVDPCGMKMYVVKKGDGVVVSRCPGRTVDVKAHNHDLQYIDRVKTPSAIMKLAADVMKDGKTPSEAVKDVKTLGVVQALERDGGLFIDSNRVRNAYKAAVQGSPNGTPTTTPRRRVHTQSNITSLPGDVTSPPLKVSCQCGDVQFMTPFGKPTALYHCHCTECQKQSASAFGTSAIYPADSLFPLSQYLQEHLTLYSRPSKSGGNVDCYLCSRCGSRLFHRIVDADGTPRPTISIKGGVIEGLDWSGGIHIWTQHAVVPIPAKARSFRESPDISPAQPMDQIDQMDSSMAPVAKMIDSVEMASVSMDPTIDPNLRIFSNIPML